MDGTRFDQLIKSMATTRVSRLTALRGLAVGAVAAIAGMDFGAEDAEAAKSRRCRSKPTECQTCKKGKCHRNNNGQKKCRRGKLRPKANGTLCSIGTCQNSVCTRSAVGCTPTNGVANTQGSCPTGQVCNANFICVTVNLGCSPANNTQGSCPAGQICNGQAICVAGCTGTGQGSCPAGLQCVNGQCQVPGGCTPTNNTQGNCAAGQVCNLSGVCVPAVGCLNTANPQCGSNQFCCPSETAQAGNCRGNLQAC